MNKEELRKLVKRKLFMGLMLGLILGIIIGGGIMAQEAYEQRIKYEAAKELFIFTLNVSVYCAESNNITFSKLQDNYLRYTLEKMIIEKIKPIDEFGVWNKTDNDAFVSGDEQ